MTFSGFDPFLGLSNTFHRHRFSFFIVNTHMTSLYQHIWFVISSFWERSHIWTVCSVSLSSVRLSGTRTQPELSQAVQNHLWKCDYVSLLNLAGATRLEGR